MFKCRSLAQPHESLEFSTILVRWDFLVFSSKKASQGVRSKYLIWKVCLHNSLFTFRKVFRFITRNDKIIIAFVLSPDSPLSSRAQEQTHKLISWQTINKLCNEIFTWFWIEKLLKIHEISLWFMSQTSREVFAFHFKTISVRTPVGDAKRDA